MSEKSSSGMSAWGIAKATGSFLYENKETVGKVAKSSAKTAYENRETLKKGLLRFCDFFTQTIKYSHFLLLLRENQMH